MQLYQQYLINQGVKIAPDGAQLATQKMMVGVAQMVSGKNLEDLDEFARDYIVGRDLWAILLTNKSNIVVDWLSSVRVN